MAAAVISSFVGTEAFNRLLQRPKEALAQHILVQRDLIREFKSIHQCRENEAIDDLRNELSYTLARVAELEEELAEAKDTLDQIIEGNTCRWDT